MTDPVLPHGDPRRETVEALVEELVVDTAAGPRPAVYSRAPWRGWKAMPPLAALAVLGWIATAVVQRANPPQPVTALRSEQALRQQMYLAAVRVNRFIRQEGRLPRDLAEAGVLLDGVRFERYRNRVYVLTAEVPGGGRLVADSRSDPGAILYAEVQR